MKPITTRSRHSNVMSKVAESHFKGLIFFNVTWRGSMYFFRRISIDSQVLTIAVRHNAPIESPLDPSQYARSSISESSIHGGSPSQGRGLPSQTVPNPSEAMSIGPMIEPTMRQDYASAAFHGYMVSSLLPVPAASRLPSDFMYGTAASDSPYLSPDSSPYSPRSELIHPQSSTHPFQLTGDLPRAQSTSLESTFPQHNYTPPLIDTSPMQSWHLDYSPLSAPMHSPMQPSMLPSVRGTMSLVVG